MNDMGILTYDVLHDMGQNPDVKLKTAVKDTKKTRALFAQVFYAVFMVFPILGFLAWLCGKGGPAMAMAVCSWPLLFLTWLLFALTFLMGVYMDDTCVELGKYTQGQKSKITEVFKCP